MPIYSSSDHQGRRRRPRSGGSGGAGCLHIHVFIRNCIHHQIIHTHRVHLRDSFKEPTHYYLLTRSKNYNQPLLLVSSHKQVALVAVAPSEVALILSVLARATLQLGTSPSATRHGNPRRTVVDVVVVITRDRNGNGRNCYQYC